MKKLLLLLTVIGMTFTACERGGGVEDNNGEEPIIPEIEIPSERLTIPAEGGELTVPITTNVEYKLTDDADWLSTGEVSKTGFTITAGENTEPSNRSATITLSVINHNIKKSIEVEQAAYPSTIELSQQDMEVECEPMQYTVEVSASCTWTAASDTEWIIIETKSGEAGTSELIFSVERNEEKSMRHGIIEVKNEELNIVAELNIAQKKYTLPVADPQRIIYYTSSDGKIVEPYAPDAFGANIISNTYTKGRGTIIFDAPVTSIGDKAFCVELSSGVIIPGPESRALSSSTSDCSTLTSITLPNCVTKIGYATFCNCSSLADIVISNGVTTIGELAFCNCSSLANVAISNGVTTIGELAFFGCSSLTSVTLPESVKTIQSEAFGCCTSLSKVYSKATTPPAGGGKMFNENTPARKIYVPATSLEAYRAATHWSDYTFDIIGYDFSIEKRVRAYNEIWYTTTDKNIVTPSRVSALGVGISSNTYEDGLGVIILDAAITTIDNYAFSGCTSLESITIPESVTKIGAEAFKGCTSLMDINIPDGVTSIGDSAFIDCKSLTDIAIPNNVITLGEYAFYCCESLTALTIGNGITSIKDFTFTGCTSLTTVTIPNSVTSIGKFAFSACKSLKNTTIGRGVTSIGESTFKGCSALTNLVIPDNITSIGGSAFSDCISLTSITIPDSVTSIGEAAFSGCTGELIINNSKLVKTDYSSDAYPAISWLYGSKFTKLTIGDNITKIGKYAFRDCPSLKSVTIGNSVTSIGDLAFYGCTSLKSVTIGNSVTSIGDRAFYGCTSLTSVTIPNSVTSIGRWAFRNCSNLTRVDIADSVTSIGEGAFACCSLLVAFYGKFASSDNRCLIVDGVLNSFAPAGLTEYTIPNSVTTIGYSAFEYCTSLTSITIPDSVTSIGDSAFEYCTSLTSVTIPDSVTSIGDYAFRDCTSLTSVTIGNGVTSIESYVFEGCTSLTSVYCKPTTPPTGSYGMFYNNASGRKFYVPTASVEAYKAASGWSDYADYIVGYDF